MRVSIVRGEGGSSLTSRTEGGRVIAKGQTRGTKREPAVLVRNYLGEKGGTASNSLQKRGIGRECVEGEVDCTEKGHIGPHSMKSRGGKKESCRMPHS